jgi:hypothetical protein
VATLRRPLVKSLLLSRGEISAFLLMKADFVPNLFHATTIAQALDKINFILGLEPSANHSRIGR